MKKILAAVITVAMMICCVVPAFAEVWQGTDELVPELVKVPKATKAPVLDGVLESSFWGEKFMHTTGAGRLEWGTEGGHIHPTDGSFEDSTGYTAAEDYYFRWDEEYLYIGVVTYHAYSSEVDASAMWSAGTDCLQIYIGLDDGDGDMYNDPHLGFGVNGNQDATAAYSSTFEQSMPDAADTATVNDGIKAAVGVDGLAITWEIAVPLADGLGSAGAIDDEYLFSCADIVEGQYYVQVGKGCLWAGKTPTDSPMLVFAEALAEEEPAAEEPAAEEPAAEEPAAEEPAAEEPAAEEPAATETVTPAPTTTTNTNPKTADVSVLFYALAAVSAIGGISVFKRK
jgi:hypothetical protein